MLFSVLSSLSMAKRAVCTQDTSNKYLEVVTLVGRQDSEGLPRVRGSQRTGCIGWQETLGGVLMDL